MYQPTPYDINFRFLGFPIRIHPLFWLVITLLGVQGHISNMYLFFVEIVLWIAAVFISILVHELGHALVFRHVYRVSSQIIFHGMGGMTVPFVPHQRRYGFWGLLCAVFLSAAGPLAGFVLAISLIVLSALLAMQFGETSFENGFMLTELTEFNVRSIVDVFIVKIISISIVWGIFNLLPIYPMDGGHIFREIFSFISPRNGAANSLVLSIVTAIVFAFLSFRFGLTIMTLLFCYFAYQNYQELSFRSFRRW
ncbi:MAG: site-2 protease family protein [Planctomycetaceae bacterium]|jgi:membrane-associated protease RseP (regulator of RpoE activity)|nr:site-2 protease family protein [Planctomycetaceae bacterium]